jgi:radical SAM protein with 4Fe4S-binding SPASM domain
MFENTARKLIRGAQKSYWSKTYRPVDAIIFLTYRCTSRCAACNIWKRPVNIDEELSWDQWKPILEELSRAGIRSIELFGGDALLRKDLLLKMIQFCSARGIGTFFPTNSSSLTKETVRDLVSAGLGTVYLSLDEVPEIAESVRGVKRHFDRVAKSIEAFRNARGNSGIPWISCITTVSALNYQYIEKLMQASCSSGADEHVLRGISEFTNASVDASEVAGIHPSPYFMPTDNKSHAFSKEQARELLECLSAIRARRKSFLPMSVDMANLQDLSEEDLTELKYPHQTCLFATTQVVISPYGNVLPCLYYKNYHLGNIQNRGLATIWGNDKHRYFCDQQKRKDIPLCEHCSIKFYHKPFIPTLLEVKSDLLSRLPK